VYNIIIRTNRSHRTGGRFLYRDGGGRGGWGSYGMEPEISGFGRFISEYNTVKFSFRNGIHVWCVCININGGLIPVKIGRRDPSAERTYNIL